MATNNPRQELIFKIQGRLLLLSRDQLQRIVSLLHDENPTHDVDNLSNQQLCDLILDFIKSEKLRALEDEGMAQLIFLDGQISDLLASDVGAAEGDPTTPPDDGSAGQDPDDKSKSGSSKRNLGKILAIAGTAVVGGVGAVLLAPVALGAAGFTSAGIAAGSYAASMMSAAAIANGGGVAAGSLVAILQSAGAVGLSATAATAVASVGAGVGAGVGAAASVLAGRGGGGGGGDAGGGEGGGEAGGGEEGGDSEEEGGPEERVEEEKDETKVEEEEENKEK